MSEQHQVCKPEIASIGAPPERHADRVVAEMLRFIAREHADPLKRIGSAINHNRAGNPVAQQRMCEAIRRAGGDTVIDVELVKAGKRGRFVIAFYDWCPWDEARQAEIRPGDPIPDKPWLACNLNLIYGRAGNGWEVDASHILFITHHALSRLAQRCDARTVDDMIAATKALWRAYRNYRKPLGDVKQNPTPDGHKLVVDHPNGAYAAALKLHEDGGVIIATILPAWWP